MVLSIAAFLTGWINRASMKAESILASAYLIGRELANFDLSFASLGGEVAYPILSHLLPGGDGGSFPAELAAEAIEEIDELVEFAKHLVFNSLVCEGFEELYGLAPIGSRGPL